MVRFFSLLGGISLLVFSLSENLRAQELNPASMDPAFFTEIKNGPEQGFYEVFVLFKDRVNAESLQQNMLRANISQAQQVSTLIQTLQAKAAGTQQPVLERIRQSREVDQENVQSFWITNMIFLRARKNLIAELSQRPDVSWIEKNEILEHDGVMAKTAAAPPVPNGKEPGLIAINAPAMWALGYTGYGRKVLIVDSGQDPNHPALRNQFLYNYSSLTNSYLSSALPDYCDPHGTGVASAAVGFDPLTRDTLGVAFNAFWMGAPFSNLRNTETNEFCVYRGSVRDVAGALQWALNPDGNASTSTDIPDVINNSYGRTISSTTECSQVWPDLFRSLDAAGIAVVFAAGNDGPTAGSSNLQASISVNEVTPFSVGAVNSNTLLVADFSARGPSLCSNFNNPSWDIKPEVVAPGARIRVANPGRTEYTTVDGTSFSAPYVAGALLLLKEAFPFLSGRELARALYNSAIDLGTTGEDNAYGKGLIDVLAAYNYLIGRGFQPIAPVAAKRDVVNINTVPRLLSCGGRMFLEVTFRNQGTEVLNNLDIVVRREFSATPLFTSKWSGALAPGASTTYLIPEFSASFGTYAVEVELKNPNGQEDERPLNNQLKKKVTVSPQPLLPPITLSASTVCSTGRNLINSSYDGDGILRWYRSQEGGSPLAEGLSFYTGGLTQDTTFFAELRFNKKAGRPDNTGSETALSDATTGGLVFDCLAPFILKTVLVYADVTGPRNIRLKRPDGSIQQRLVNVSKVGENRLTLGFTVDQGEGYVLDISLGRELYVSKSGNNFPYQIPGVLRIKSSESSDPLVYSFFYDWEVEYNYPCGRLPVRIDVDESTTSLKAAFAGPVGVIPLVNGEAVVNFQNNSSAASLFAWTLGDGNTSMVENPVHTYRSPGKYQVVLTASNGGACADVATGLVEVTAVTGVSERNELDQRIRVFPNPSRDVATLDMRLEKPEEIRLRLVDLLGRTLKTWDLGKVQELQMPLDLSGLQSGSYQLIFSGAGFSYSKKLMVVQ